MTDATKASILLGALALAAMSGGAFGLVQRYQKQAAIVEAQRQASIAEKAGAAEAIHKAARAAAEQQAQAALQDVARLKTQVAAHPVPPAAEPVPADASAGVVVAGLQSLGLTPEPIQAPLAVGLTLPDGRTVLQWGREAQRIPPLVARLGALETLAQAQEGATSALLRQQAATDQALTAADTRADAQQRRAELLQRAIDLTPRWRPTAAGVIYSMDATGARHLGAIITRTWGPIEVGALYLNNQAGVIAAYRF